jgi:hypothetical protein
MSKNSHKKSVPCYDGAFVFVFLDSAELSVAWLVFPHFALFIHFMSIKKNRSIVITIISLLDAI